MAQEHSEQVDNMLGRSFGSCKVTDKIAVGGFGTVYKAVDEKLNITRAIKIFHSHLSGEKGFQKRFEVEMRLLAQLDHLNIVRVISAIDEADCTGFIMEYVEGETLADILEEEGALEVEESLEIFKQVARSIAYAHNLEDQVIHRDLSPDNIMLRPDGVVKIMDFGIAKTIGSEKVTQTGIVLGKPTYMAPEQFEGTVSVYTDQYALGIILYEMVTGRVPFDAESPIALYKLHLNEEPVPPKEINESIPTYLNEIILKSLTKEEKKRFRNVDKMIEAIVNKGHSTESTENRSATLMLEATLAMEEENYPEALAKVGNVLELEPNNKEALSKRERILQMQESGKKQDLLEEFYQQALFFLDAQMQEQVHQSLKSFLKVAQQYPHSHVTLRHTRSLRERAEEAYRRAEKALKQEAERIDRLSKMGKKLFQKDKFEQAIEKFAEAIALNPYNEWLIKLKNLSQKKLKMVKVEENYHQGILALKNQEYDKALAAFDEVLALHPYYKDTRKYREMAKNELGKMAQSHRELEQLYKEALDLYEKWEFSEAIKKFEQILEIDETHMEAKMLLSQSLARSDDENKIEEIGFFYNKGMTLFKGQQWSKAIQCFDRVLSSMESHRGALEHKKIAEAKLAEQKQLEAAFDEALEHFRNSEYTQALQLLDYILSIDKNHKQARQYRTLCQELQQGLAEETNPTKTF